MKVLNPTKKTSRMILLKKMNKINSDEENEIIRQEVEKHNKHTNDTLLFFQIKEIKISTTNY